MPLIITKRRVKLITIKRNKLNPNANLYLRVYSKYHLKVSEKILIASIEIVKRTFKNDSIRYQKVKENAMKDQNQFLILLPSFHFGQNNIERIQEVKYIKVMILI